MSIGLQRGLIRIVARDSSGNAIPSASVAIYNQGATVSAATSGMDPLTVSVYDVGSLLTTGSTVQINTGTTQYGATVVDENTVTINTFAGPLAVSIGDRLVSIAGVALETYSQSAGANATNPITTGSDGVASAYVRGGVYDAVITKAGITTQLLQDIWVQADEERIQTFPTTSAVAVKRLIAVRTGTWTSADILYAIATGTTDAFWVDGAGGIHTIAGLTTATGVTIVGNSTVTGTLTVSSTLIGTAAITAGTTITAGTGITVTTGGITVTGNSTITGTLTALTGITSSGTASFADVTNSGRVFHTGLETIASAATVSVAATTFIVEMTGTTNINIIQLAGGVPVAGDDGRVLVIRSTTGSFTVNAAGGAGSIANSRVMANGDASMLRYRHSTTFWEWITGK